MKSKLGFILSVFLGCWLWGTAQSDPNLITFEAGPLGGGFAPISENGFIDNTYFNANYGVSFYNTNGFQYFQPRYARMGPATGSGAAAFVVSNNLEPMCTQMTTTDDNPYDAEHPTGCWMLTDDDIGIHTNPNALIIHYDQSVNNCTTAAGYIYDIDGDWEVEGWKLEVFSVGGGSTPDQTIYLLAPRWQFCTNCPTLPAGATVFNAKPGGGYSAGDGDDTYWELSTNGNAIDYVMISYFGDPARGVGVAFDNFYYCSSGKGDPCETEPDFSFSVNGCLVDFADETPYMPKGTIVAHHWDFGDGSFSNEANPQHQFAPNTSNTVTLTITIFDGTNCCTKQVVKQVDTQACEDCDADIGFIWEPDPCDPCKIKLTATVYNNTTAIQGYHWKLPDGTLAKGEEISRILSGGEVCLTILMTPNTDSQYECCTRTICGVISCGTMGQYYDFDPEGLGLMPDPLEDYESHGENNESSTDEGDLGSSSLFPNPSDKEINLQLFLSNEKVLTAELYSINGQRIELEQLQLPQGINQVKLDVLHVPDGFYVLKVQGSDYLLSEKVEIRH